MKHRHTLASWALGAALAAITITLYSLTLARQHSGDDLQKAIIVENALGGRHIWHPVSLEDAGTSLGPGEAIHPRYLLEVPLAMQLTTLFRGLGWGDRALQPMQIANMLFGVLGAMALYAALLKLTWPPLAFALSLALVTSTGWWYFSTHADFALAGAAWLAVALAFLVNLLAAGPGQRVFWLSLGLGFALAPAILFFLTSAFFLPVVILAIWLHFWREVRDPASGRLALCAFGAAVLLVGGGGALLVLLAHQGGGSLAALAGSAVYLDSSAPFWYSVRPADLARAFLGIGKSLVQYPLLGRLTPGEYYTRSSTLGGMVMLAWYGVQALLFLLPFALVFRRRHSLSQYRVTALVLFGWVAIQLLFGIIWEPIYTKWWLATLLAWLMLAALAAALYLDSRRSRWVGTMIVSLYVLAALTINLAYSFGPQTLVDARGPEVVAGALRASSSPGDIFISANSTDVDLYLPYFADRRVISLPLARIFFGEDSTIPQERIRAILQGHAGGTARVYLYDCSSEEAAGLLAALDLPVSVTAQQALPENWLGLGTVCRLSLR